MSEGTATLKKRINITISQEILEYLRKEVTNLKYGSVSHAINAIVHEHMNTSSPVKPVSPVKVKKEAKPGKPRDPRGRKPRVTENYSPAEIYEMNKQGMMQTEIAEKLGFTRQAISKVLKRYKEEQGLK